VLFLESVEVAYEDLERVYSILIRHPHPALNLIENKLLTSKGLSQFI
jgi:hypothetical protein